MVWCPYAQRYDTGRLPQSTPPAVRDFYLEVAARAEGLQSTGGDDDILSQRWYELCCTLPAETGVEYLQPEDAAGAANPHRYELAPRPANLLSAFAALLGLELPHSWEEAAPACALLGMGSVLVHSEDAQGASQQTLFYR